VDKWRTVYEIILILLGDKSDFSRVHPNEVPIRSE